MTNKELIVKIKAEIERRITDSTFGAKLELIDILAWLDTLESEKPMNQEGLEEEIVKVCDDFVFPLYGLDDEFGRELINKIAHHFAQWGYLRAAEKYDEIEYNRQRAEEDTPNDLEEAARKYQESVPVDTTIHYCGADEDVYFANRIVDAVIAGANWQAEQLLKSSPLPEDTVLFNKGVAEGRRLERDEFEKNRLAACSNQTEEEYDRETDFALEIIEKEHRQPTFSDAINYGMRLQKEQGERIYREFFNERNQGDASFRDLLAYKEGHRDGMEEQKEQMLKDAVEGEITKDNRGNNVVRSGVFNNGFEIGDKVRVIVCKKEDKKDR